MKILVKHRDEGSRKLMGRLAESVPEMEWIDCAPDAPVEPLDVDAVIAVGPVPCEAIEHGAFGFIQCVGTGYEHVDVAAANSHGVYVANMPASETGNAESVAEHAILLMLALSRKLDAARDALRNSAWAQPLGSALFGKTICLVGLGDVGMALASRLHAFSLHIIATRRDPSKAKPSFVHVFPASALAEIIPAADFLVLCARADDGNRNLIDASVLSRMKPGAILINVARGSLVDHEALLAALQSEKLRGVGLDVFWEEPVDPTHPLLQHPHVIATPHVAGVTDINLHRTLLLIAENLRRYARREVPHYLVNAPPQPRFSLLEKGTTVNSN